MNQYLEIAKGIHSWLETLQVKKKYVRVTERDHRFAFHFEHPTKGDICVELDAIPDDIFVRDGISFKKASGNRLKVYDAGGIYDPVDGRVQGEHYGTTHFALLSAILFHESGEEFYLQRCRSAIAFHLRTSPAEYQPMSEWMYHWDFQNYAFALTYRLLKEHLPVAERQRWETGLACWKTNHKNTLTNWAGMRAWAFAERHTVRPQLFDSAKIWWNLRYLKAARSEDGCFDDNRGLSRPIQYHIFTVALLHRLYMLTQSDKLKRWFDAGIDYFLPFVDPEGCFNYLGRGHEQIFGYGAAIYALEAASKENGDERAREKARQLFDYLLRFKKGDHFPLVLNDRSDDERPGWYDYHHLTVYNAFLGVWLGLTHLLRNPERAVETHSSTYSWISEPTQTVIVSRKNYFLNFYGGLPEYMSEGGITPHHLWWSGFGALFSCPGGPTPDRFGLKTPPGAEKNFFAPIAKNSTNWFVPAQSKCKRFEYEGETLTMVYDYGPFSVERKVDFSEEQVRFEDVFSFSENKTYEDFRFFNWPLPDPGVEVSFRHAEAISLVRGGSTLLLTFADKGLPLEFGEELLSAKGHIRTITKRERDFQAVAGDSRRLSFKLAQEA